MKVAVFGDSIPASCHSYLAFFYGQRGWTVEPQWYPGTAPCDWLAHTLSVQCDIAVVSFSGNLAPCTQNRGSMVDVYRQDFDTMGARLGWRNIPVLWASPPQRVGTKEADNVFIGLMQQVATKYKAAGQRFSNCAEVLTSGVGANRYYESWMPSEHQDMVAGFSFMGVSNVREPDGVHLTSSGQRRYAERIAKDTWR